MNQNELPLHITQHKRFMPDDPHPNFCFAKTSFMLNRKRNREKSL
jgi:hypothetical protein